MMYSFKFKYIKVTKEHNIDRGNRELMYG